MLHIPILRSGVPYESLKKENLTDHRTGKVLATISQANSGLIAKDIRDNKNVWQYLQNMTLAETLSICKRAADLFLQETISFAGVEQSPQNFIQYQSATTGMPHSMCKANMEKVHWVLHNLEKIISSLAGRVNFNIIEKGYGFEGDIPISFLPQAKQLGAVLPSNSPGVHSLWLPALALRFPVVLKPGSREPWTPFRLCYSFIEAGYPKEAFSCYPTDYHGGNTIMLGCERAMIFGDDSTVRQWQHDHRVEVHGTGFSKVILGADVAENWEDYLDVIFRSVAANGGRSCINASAIWTPKYGKEIAAALAQKMAQVVPRKMDDPQAELAAFSDPRIANAISNAIDAGLCVEGAEDATAKYYNGSRIETIEGSTFLKPTLIYCDNVEHPLANREFLFPYAAVVTIPEDEMLQKIEKTLVATVLTKNKKFEDAFLFCPQIDRLNIGSIPTCHVDWLQPHEGNLFEFLFQRRSFQKEEM